jgi:ABC transporter substrate binding protein
LRERPDALLVFTESLTIALREQIGYFALANRLPMISALREFAEVGGLATYGTSRPDLWRRSASYVDKIVRGAKPADLPVQQPTRFELVINLKGREGHRPRYCADHACTRRRGDRVSVSTKRVLGRPHNVSAKKSRISM